jgi:hypothetical protein
MSEERRLEMMRIDTLVPALRNPRRHDLDMLRASFDRFGFTVPAILDERTGRLVAGHGRTQLLQVDMKAGATPAEGIETDRDGVWKVPVVRGWASTDDAEADAYLVADNRLTEIAGWDGPALLEGLRELQRGPGLDGVGYLPDDVDDLYAKLQESAPAAPAAGNARNTQVRSLVLDYPLDQYGYVAAMAHRARRHYEAPSNAELFVAMLREYDEEHPAA